jgi:ribonuclease HI
MITAYGDGSGKNGSGLGAASFIIVKDNIVIHQHTDLLQGPTNNVAEYTSLLNALKYCIAEGYDRVMFCSDSELVVKQLNREYQTTNPKMRELRDLFVKTVNEANMGAIVKWVPRTNIYVQLADHLNRLAVSRAIK